MYKLLGKTLRLPVIQGGMGMGISMGNLAGHVAKYGAVGTISMVEPGFDESDFEENKKAANERALLREVKKAREIADGNGLIGVNIMYALTDYEDLVNFAVRAEVDFIVVGAGLPLNLPKLVSKNMPIAPIISSVRALKILLKKWEKYHRTPDFLIIEGMDAGGHLGFKEINTNFSLEELTREVLDYLSSEGLNIPVFAAGGLNYSTDLKKYRDLGAFGIQLGTRFLATHESDCHENLKEVIVNSTSSDLIVFDSPVGFKGRGIYNHFLQSAKKNPIKSQVCVNCVKTCNPIRTRFCIFGGLKASVMGDINNGLIFAGKSIDFIHEILSVREVLNKIQEGLS